jgi:hypothetical protein
LQKLVNKNKKHKELGHSGLSNYSEILSSSTHPAIFSQEDHSLKRDLTGTGA